MQEIVRCLGRDRGQTAQFEQQAGIAVDHNYAAFRLCQGKTETEPRCAAHQWHGVDAPGWPASASASLVATEYGLQFCNTQTQHQTRFAVDQRNTGGLAIGAFNTVENKHRQHGRNQYGACSAFGDHATRLNDIHHDEFLWVQFQAMGADTSSTTAVRNLSACS